MSNFIMLTVILAVIGIYFMNNPMKHGKAYRWRCLWNWLPMGLSYAMLYMARYNLTVSKSALGNLMTESDFGVIFGVGTTVYALSFLVNGPLIDKIGGKKGILIGMMGSAFANIAMGFATYKILTAPVGLNFILIFSILYGINMYFQSYGAAAIVKVNAHWFHVRERGVFSGIFGSLIAMGIYFAFDWGQAIVNAVKVNLKTGIHLDPIQNLLRNLTGAALGSTDQLWFLFFIPAAILIVFFVIELFILKDSPSEAGFEDFDTHDASSGEMDQTFSTLEIFKKILTNPIILTIAGIEFCSGVLRNGIMHWYRIFLFAEENIPIIGREGQWFASHWGLLLCLAGIFGAFFVGTISDKLFQSRRGPSVAFMYFGMFIAILIMIYTLFRNQILLGSLMIFISMCVIGVHGLLSGTATMDFGGRKKAATAVAIIDGIVYLGTAFQSFSLGYLIPKSWNYWPYFLLPFTIIGFFLAIKIWHDLPHAVRKGVPAK